MKKLFKTFAILAIGAFTLASCNDKNDIDLGQYEEQERQIEAALAAEKIKIEDYLNDLTEEDVLFEAEEDTVTIVFTLINKRVTRGIWYKVLSEPTDDSYEYKMDGTYPKAAKVKINYTAKLLDGTVVESATAKNYDWGVQSTIMNAAWFYSFYPYSIELNGQSKVLEGLTAEGLKVGSKFAVVVPSFYAYGSASKATDLGTIPANSPLVYEFEVLEIE